MKDFKKAGIKGGIFAVLKCLRKVILKLLVTPKTWPWKLKGMKMEYSQYFIRAP